MTTQPQTHLKAFHTSAGTSNSRRHQPRGNYQEEKASYKGAETAAAVGILGDTTAWKQKIDDRKELEARARKAGTTASLATLPKVVASRDVQLQVMAEMNYQCDISERALSSKAFKYLIWSLDSTVRCPHPISVHFFFDCKDNSNPAPHQCTFLLRLLR